VAFVKGFGSYLPGRIVTNEEIGELVGLTSEWIVNVSGIEQRRYARDDETVADMAVQAAERCLKRAKIVPEDIGLVVMASGTSEQCFPAPGSRVAHELGLSHTPVIDLQIASAGSLFAMGIARDLVLRYGNVLVVAAEKMSPVIRRKPMHRSTVPLFGDGAGACVISTEMGMIELLDATLHSDGAHADQLCLEWDAPLKMNGRNVIQHASRKMPSAIRTVLERNEVCINDVEAFLLHQANQHLLEKVVAAVGAPKEKLYTVVKKYGNTSSASMLIAADEYFREHKPSIGKHVVFAAFGAGYQWGAVLGRISS
jgi:3-oxoacyl-[acyl-carrier-protein] synthase III